VCEIKKLRRLKTRQEKLVNRILEKNPLSVLPPEYVSESGLTYSDISEKIEKLQDCASIIELRDSFVKTGDSFEQVMKVAAANYCKQHVVCPICADRMQVRRRAKFNDAIKNQVAMVETGKRFAYMITYTVKDGESLSERMHHLKEAKKNFRKMGQRRGMDKNSRGEAAKIKAAISTMEIKRGKNSNMWHAHYHDLVFTNTPIDYMVYDQDKKRKLDQKYGGRVPADKLRSAAIKTVMFNGEQVPASKISTEWLKASCGDSMSIYVDRIRHIPRGATGKKKRMFRKMSFIESVLYQAKECLKYPGKVDLNNVSDSIILLNETYNKRMTATYGEFRGIKGDNYNNDTDESESFVMVWNAGNYGDAIPGRVRDLASEDETETRSKVGKMLGEYRRKRRYYIDAKKNNTAIPLYTANGVREMRYVGAELSTILNDLKEQFRKKVNAVWSLYKNKKNSTESLKNANCDNYNHLLYQMFGIYDPSSNRSSMYQAAFS
jgi:hypothetical protein